MNMKCYNASNVGKAGEHAVAAQLILRGVPVYFPAADFGVDLMTGSGCRIQVKTAHMVCTPKMIDLHGEGTYMFTFSRTKRMAITNERSEVRQKPAFSAFCDFVVLWGVEQNRFWILPASLADEAQAFVMGREDRRSFIGNIADVREMKRLGYKRHEIAKKYNVNPTLINNLLNLEGFESKGPSATRRARACENAWESILDFQRPGFVGQMIEPVEPAQEEKI